MQDTVQLGSKFTAHIGQHAYIARLFARHEELHTFDTRASRLLAHTTILTSYVCYMRFVRTNTHTHASYIASAHKFARELFHTIATCTHYIIKRVNLQ